MLGVEVVGLWSTYVLRREILVAAFIGRNFLVDYSGGTDYDSLRMLKPLAPAMVAIATFAQNSPMELLKPALDVGISVSDIDKAKDFYGTTLGLKLAGTLPMPDGTTMFRYQAGTAVLKVRATPKAAKYPTGVREAIGFRLLTLYVDDLPGILERWTAAGNAAPGMMGNFTLISDPDGNPVELVTAPAGTDKIAVGLTVSDVERSRKFYGEMLGLAEEKAGKNGDSTFLAGKTLIRLRKGTGDDLPKHTGNVANALGFRYFTFMVKDLDSAAVKLAERGAKIVVKPVDFGKIARIMMIEDPDGNWIELAALTQAR